MTLQPPRQIPGVYHRKIGDIVVTAISDGYLDGSLDVMRNVDLEKAHQLLRDAFRPARRTSVNAFLIHSKGRSAIVDTGSGNYLLPTAGFVQHNLAAAGIDRLRIDAGRRKVVLNEAGGGQEIIARSGVDDRDAAL